MELGEKYDRGGPVGTIYNEDTCIHVWKFQSINKN